MARKLFLFMMVSADGYFEGPNHDLSWHNVSPEFHAFSDEQLSQTGLILFGYKTFQMMASYWTTPEALAVNPTTTKAMNEMPKVVVSTTLFEPKWDNTAVVLSDSIGEEIQRLKSMSGKSIALFGSNDLCVKLMERGLVDEFRLMMNPIALGSGSSVFRGLKRTTPLQLVSTQQFKSGNVLNCYSIRAGFKTQGHA